MSVVLLALPGPDQANNTCNRADPCLSQMWPVHDGG